MFSETPPGHPAPARPRVPEGTRSAVWLVSTLTLLAILAPVLANDRPILARLGESGRIVAPALADLPIVGRIFDLPEVRTIPWHRPGASARVFMMPPVPYSYRGIRLEDALRPPDRRHLLGTDALGRDLLARLIHGTRPSLAVGFGATAFALLFGVLLGVAAGLRAGLVDLLIMRVVDTVACFPPFILALAFMAAAGHGGVWPMVAGIALNRWTGMARYVRGEILRQRGGDLWASVRATGASSPRLVLRHLFPLLAPPLAVLASFGVAHAIVLESGLSFVGFGVDPPTPSWGTILAEARGTLDSAWWPVVFPALALLLILGALCVAGERAGGTPSGRLLTRE